MTHQNISYIKSAIRILGYFLLPIDLVSATIVLIISEIIGVYEEVGH